MKRSIETTLKSKLKQELDAFRLKCRQLKLSVTSQRRVVFEILIQSTKHPTADQIYEAALKQLPDISRASVYRILETFAQFRIVRKIEHRGVAVRYDGRFCHHHMICSVCGTIEDYPTNENETFDYPKTVAGGFEITGYSITFDGICQKCQINQKRSNDLKSDAAFDGLSFVRGNEKKTNEFQRQSVE